MNTTNTTNKTAKVRVSFQGYDWRNEFTVVSPTGRRVRLQCNGKWADMSAALLALVNKYQHCDANAHAWGDFHPETITFGLMAEIKGLA